MIVRIRTVALTVAAVALTASVAHAQATRTWVSGVGDDATRQPDGALQDVCRRDQQDRRGRFHRRCWIRATSAAHHHEVDHDRRIGWLCGNYQRRHQRHHHPQRDRDRPPVTCRRGPLPGPAAGATTRHRSGRGGRAGALECVITNFANIRINFHPASGSLFVTTRRS